jgi:hypothetical protein
MLTHRRNAKAAQVCIVADRGIISPATMNRELSQHSDKRVLSKTNVCETRRIAKAERAGFSNCFRDGISCRVQAVVAKVPGGEPETGRA